MGKRRDSYWWHGSISHTRKGTWWPVWYIEWGGRGYDRWGAPLLAALIPIWGEWKISFKLDLPKKPETSYERMLRVEAEYYAAMKPSLDDELDARLADHEERLEEQLEIDRQDRLW